MRRTARKVRILPLLLATQTANNLLKHNAIDAKLHRTRTVAKPLTDSICRRAFDTPELLETILLEPSQIDVFHCRRVSSQLYRVITGSPQLQNRMRLKPYTGTGSYVACMLDSRHAVLERRKSNSGFRSPRLVHRRSRSFDYMPFTFRAAVPLPGDAIWHKSYLTSPPVCQVQVSLVWYIKDAAAGVLSATVRLQEGTTFEYLLSFLLDGGLPQEPFTENYCVEFSCRVDKVIQRCGVCRIIRDLDDHEQNERQGRIDHVGTIKVNVQHQALRRIIERLEGKHNGQTRIHHVGTALKLTHN